MFLFMPYCIKANEIESYTKIYCEKMVHINILIIVFLICVLAQCDGGNGNKTGMYQMKPNVYCGL